VIGDRQVDLPGPSDVVLSGVESLADQHHRQLVPLPLRTSGHTAALQFQGVSRVSVNGVSETTFWRRHEATLTAAGIVATILGAILAFVALLQGLLRRQPREA